MSDQSIGRRKLLKLSGISLAGGMMTVSSMPRVVAQDPVSSPIDVRVLNARDRVPMSFIIDDSTCLVNMGHFCMPQFAEAWPTRPIYQQPWQEWPREIPDAFVREFGEWCAEQGVRGKYSIVPYPACVGWMDRGLPGWSKQALQDSLSLVRDLMMPHWDIHPEMITHTRVIDLKTGRPMESADASTMENSYPQTDISTDHLAEYLAYALQILKNCGLTCEGITTPGGFGNRVKDKLPIAVHQAVRDVFSTELPHYFKYVHAGDQSTDPKLEFIGSQRTIDNLTVNVPAGTGDWFGGWEGTQAVAGDKYCNADATAGRMVEMIQRGQPAVMLCHWPGLYCNGAKTGFTAFQKVVLALAERYGDRTQWMKLSEIARYAAAKEFVTFSGPTGITGPGDSILAIKSPIRCDGFTFEIATRAKSTTLSITQAGQMRNLKEVASRKDLIHDSFTREADNTVVCVNIAKGDAMLVL
ncbi:hypothetical protein [Stieleria varia]|uniref:Uncharacterized protein n=1 Tax=Stieleria varia TaxID=2528005 RepID=A0A5C6A5I3_9BACT|nr:hypothetical protein [Stieleria varia]TWT94655.1 hypothetical protein Pla52n_54760 [Stieleria varia]